MYGISFVKHHALNTDTTTNASYYLDMYLTIYLTFSKVIFCEIYNI